MPTTRWMALLPLAFLAALFLYPLAAVIRIGLSPGATAAVLSDPYYLGVVGFSLWQALLSTVLTLALGLPGAFVFAHFRFRGRSLLRALATVPFVLPTVVTAAGFTALLGPRGLLSELIRALGGQPPQLLNTLTLVLLAHVFYNYSVVLRIVGGLWGSLDPRLEQAAAVLGAGKWRVLRQVTLPLLLPAIGAAATLIFIFTFSSFGVVLLLGGPRLATIEVEIYRQTTQSLRLDIAAALALVQMLVTLAASVVYTRLLARSRGRLDLRARRDVLRPAGTLGARLLLGLNVAVLLALLLPLLALAWRSVTLPSSPSDPAALTLDYYRLLWQTRRGALFLVPPIRAVANSIGFALAATVLALLIGLPAAYAAARAGAGAEGRPGLGGRALDVLYTLPLGVSAVMLGLGYIVALGPLGVLGSPLLIPCAHALLAFPFVVRTLVPALRGLNPRLAEAARTLGAGPLRVLRAVELPLLAPALLSGATFAFTASLGEFGAALLLARPEYPTVPIVIARLLGQPGATNYGQALALGTLLMLASVAGFLAIERAGTGSAGEI
jgi:thiamine transport system permease protein